MLLVKIKSPITGYDNVTLLKTFSTQKIVGDWQEFFGIDINAELGSYPDFHLFQCNVTGLRFFYPLDIFGSAQLYEKLMKFEWYYMNDKWEYRIALQDLQNCGTALEIGCGHGHFVNQASKKGIQIEGIDSNDRAILEAQQNGLNVHKGSVEELLAQKKNQYDYLCSFQVLEHLPDPLEFLKNCTELLKLNGQLLLSVPNINSFLKYQYNLLDMPPHHMTQWSVYSFRALENFLPLKLENARFEPLADYHISGYLQAKENQFKEIVSRLPEPLVKSVINKCESFLRKGLNKYTKGQSLYVKFRKK
ncbi:class I SAM-dependent methyltransferase [filamentous cyanobacterium CCT1]|nr:class I SAM-dependent methyltransferase [filamentous cyanobacterium CCT1]PSN80598.1 class I SAM-dependent methyltransferase [filamentous cyanobacterium CCP4]